MIFDELFSHIKIKGSDLIIKKTKVFDSIDCVFEKL